MADPTRELERLAIRHANAVATIRTRALDVTRRAWLQLDAYRPDDLDVFARIVVPVVQGAQLRTSALTAAYLSQYETIATGEPATLAGVAADVVTDLRSVPPLEEYQRPGATVRRALADGHDLVDAVRMGLDRARSLVATDVQLAKTHTARALLADRGDIVGYRRTLTGNVSCGLCIVASTQRYHRSELMPIHPGCDCGVAPIHGRNDPGQILDADRLTDVHTAIEERFGMSDAGARDPIDYRSALIVHEHGDIGPVLAVRGQTFTGPADL